MSGNFSTTFNRDELKWVMDENLKMPGEYASRLLFSTLTNDWRDIIPRIEIPTLVVSAPGITPSCQWAAEMIPGATLVGFEESEGGSHFMFMENPDKFNQIVREFLAGASS